MTPGGSYYLLAEALEPDALRRTSNGDLRLPLEIYVKDVSNRPHIVSVLLFVQVKDGAVSVHTQTVGITQHSW